MVKQTYFSESHKKYSEACQKEVAEMSKRQYSFEDVLAQSLRNKEKCMSANQDSPDSKK